MKKIPVKDESHKKENTREKILNVLASGKLQILETSVGLFEKSVLFKVGYIRLFFSREIEA